MGGQPGDGLVPVVLGGMGEDGVRGHHPPCAIHHGDLDAGAQPRVQAQGRQAPSRGGQQQGREVAGEDADRLLLRRIPQAPLEVQVQAHRQLDPPGLAHRLQQPGIRRPAAVLDAEAFGDHEPADCVRVLALARQQIQIEDALIAPAEQGQGPVGRDLVDGLAVVEVVGELVALLLLTLHHLGHQDTLAPEVLAQAPGQFRVLGEALHEDLAGPLQGGIAVRHPLGRVHVAQGQGPRVLGRVRQEPVRQGFEPGLPGDLGLGAALGFVGEVEVLQALLGVRPQDLGAQCVGQLSLFLDAAQHRVPAVPKLAQVAQAFLQEAQLDVIQAAGDLLAVTGDEGDGRALVEQGDGRLHLGRVGLDILGDDLCDAGGGHAWCLRLNEAGATRARPGRGGIVAASGPGCSGLWPTPGPKRTLRREAGAPGHGAAGECDAEGQTLEVGLGAPASSRPAADRRLGGHREVANLAGEARLHPRPPARRR